MPSEIALFYELGEDARYGALRNYPFSESRREIFKTLFPTSLS